ncbi:Phosphotransferase enzyme family protein [Friedmanniella luteola]|uniref:Phosphotransferase enzyme family protein n=1 Tax=Friedmanniella luteola TaxID=546871 RepID=A0A1H1U5A2_9ACTN|nr:aminoglycoside phosphotransferase family protein [Friedmanniella luteola]SDS67668.1 Phosphotransferase enzyme family protein [Friedmanniella luteola]
MQTSDVARATRAATAVASELDLRADDALVLHNSNKLTLRLTPCDVVARVTHAGEVAAQLELERARRLAGAGCPVGVPEPRVDPTVRTRDGFDVTLWDYHEPVATHVPAPDYARALERLHAGLRQVDLASPRFTDRIAEAEEIAADPGLSPELGDADRAFLGGTLSTVRRRIEDRGAVEQLLHGEPHPGNLLGTTDGALFIDFETLCRGPVEFDLAHVPAAVCEHYRDVDHELVDDCRQLVLAMVAAWRWRVGDEFPDRRRWGQEFLRSLRAGPPWPTLDAMTSRVAPR